VRAVAELENGADDADDESEEQLQLVVMFGVADVPVNKAEIEGQRQDDEKPEPDTFAAHGCSVR
jgi:hypothetical protein